MKAIVFDSDGVLVDSMSSHYKAWKIAFKEVSNIDVDRKTIYLLEGMRGIDLAKKVFELKTIMAIIVSNRLLNELASKKMRFSEIYCFPLLPKPMKVLRT